MLNIRFAQISDAAAIARLNLLFNEVDAPPEQYAARLADARRVDLPILAEVDGHAVGFANLRLAPSVFYAEPYAELSELFVEESYRRQRIGQALVQFAENLARQAGAEEMVVLTGFDNHSAQLLYFQQGYKLLDLALSKKLKQSS